eukprot:GHVH01008257.1.p1 GENE.GHVH01008257.1~~GHVH01008257.1.p1  ORF type:complete len:193 (-),score=13.90 GHVH01008257.1:35-613(-)
MKWTAPDALSSDELPSAPPLNLLHLPPSDSDHVAMLTMAMWTSKLMKMGLLAFSMCSFAVLFCRFVKRCKIVNRRLDEPEAADELQMQANVLEILARSMANQQPPLSRNCNPSSPSPYHARSMTSLGEASPRLQLGGCYVEGGAPLHASQSWSSYNQYGGSALYAPNGWQIPGSQEHGYHTNMQRTPERAQY